MTNHTLQLITDLRAAAAQVPTLQARVDAQTAKQDDIDARLNAMRERWATQCIICGTVKDPNPDPTRCPSCAQVGTDLHVFPVTMGVL